jgi:hypothetical protein
MDQIEQSASAKLFIRAIYGHGFPLKQAEGQLISVFGSIASRSPLFSFHFTRHYEPEMGGSPLRRFFIFQTLIKKEDLASNKRATIELEQRLAILRGDIACRRINLDPGYLTLSQLVLATTKGRAHRIYLADGIFADLHLHYQGESFRPLAWTYPDHRTPVALASFTQARRESYLQLKREPPPEKTDAFSRKHG